MKLFLMKFIRGTQGGKVTQQNEEDLKTIISFYRTIKSELSEIEKIL